MGPYSAAHGALVAVIPSPQKAVPAEGVPTWGRHRLIQHLQTQDALELIHSVCNPCPASHFTLHMRLHALLIEQCLHSRLTQQASLQCRRSHKALYCNATIAWPLVPQLP